MFEKYRMYKQETIRRLGLKFSERMTLGAYEIVQEGRIFRAKEINSDWSSRYFATPEEAMQTLPLEDLAKGLGC